jgi:hypothetical protein
LSAEKENSMATVTISFEVTAVLKCSKKAAKAYNDNCEEEGFAKLTEKAIAFLELLPDAESVEVSSMIEEADDES